MNIANVKQVYLIGIGGIGMSALARYFNHLGLTVFGYDKTESFLTRQLADEGIRVTYTDIVEEIPFSFKQFSQENLLVYTPAIPKDLKISSFFIEIGYRLFKRSEVLGLISENYYTIAVAGTHGKTTTSSMIAHILTDSGHKCSAFLGGIAANYNSNILFADNNYLVVEADEFDRSFLTLHPDIAVVTSTDADHLDIYGDLDHMLASFNLFIQQVSADGKRIVKKGLNLPFDLTYSTNNNADAYASNIEVRGRSFYFDYQYNKKGVVIEDILLGIAGKHNVENAVAAITVALELGIEQGSIKEALASFKGVKRRFEYIVNEPDVVFIDDYAHHPEELKACLLAVRSLFPHDEITCIFQPHLFTRTRDFAAGFAESLALADVLILMDIYPAREQPIAGITSDWLLEKVELENKMKLDGEQILAYIKQNKPKVTLTVGAGNIDLLVEPIKKVLTNV